MEAIDYVINRLRTGLPSGITVSEREAAYNKGGPNPGTVTVALSINAAGGNPNLIALTLDIDVWDDGPDSTGADNTAHSIEALLHGWSVNTERQGTVRLQAGARTTIEENEKVAHVSMTFSGRGIRRY